MDYKIYTTDYDIVEEASTFLSAVDKSSFEDAIASRDLVLPDLGEIPAHPVTFLIEASGSMRSQRISSAIASLRVMGDLLEAQGVPFEILAFTTRAWKGGRPREEYRSKTINDSQMQDDLVVPEPGRLNELRHIIIKSMDDAWSDSKSNLAYLTMGGLMKENIDGEAILWAADRMSKSSHPDGGIVIIGDGPPVDDATLAMNRNPILNSHLSQVVFDLHQEGVPLTAAVIQQSSPAWRTDYNNQVNVYIDDNRLKLPENVISLSTGIHSALLKNAEILSLKKESETPSL